MRDIFLDTYRIPYLNIFENTFIDPKFLDYVNIKQAENQNKTKYGDLFFTTSSETPDEVGMTSVLYNNFEELYLNSFCFGFRLHSFDILLPRFAGFLFRSSFIRKNISTLAQGSTRYNLSKSIFFDKLFINLPPLPHQRKIARILTTIDNVIEKTESAIAKYKAIKQGMMHDLFTRGIDAETGKLRPTKEEAPHLYKKTELGWTPKEWEVEKLEDVCDVRDGTHESPKYVEYGIPFVTSKNLTEKGIDLTNVSYISYDNHKKFSERSFVQRGDILFGMIGTLGKPIIVDINIEFSIKNVALIKFQNSTKLSNIFCL